MRKVARAIQLREPDKKLRRRVAPTCRALSSIDFKALGLCPESQYLAGGDENGAKDCKALPGSTLDSAAPN